MRSNGKIEPPAEETAGGKPPASREALAGDAVLGFALFVENLR